MSEPSENNVTNFSNGEVYFWIEQGASIHLKAVTKYGDPVELSVEEARELAQALLEYAALLEDDAGIAR